MTAGSSNVLDTRCFCAGGCHPVLRVKLRAGSSVSLRSSNVRARTDVFTQHVAGRACVRSITKRLVREAEEKLVAHTHPDPYVIPYMPGGSKFMRNPPPPFEVGCPSSHFTHLCLHSALAPPQTAHAVHKRRALLINPSLHLPTRARCSWCFPRAFPVKWRTSHP